MSIGDNYRIAVRGDCHNRRFAVQRRVPAHTRWFFWTVPEQWVQVPNGNDYRGFIYLSAAQDFRNELIRQDSFNASEWVPLTNPDEPWPNFQENE